jgi:hypothetical protein
LIEKPSLEKETLEMRNLRIVVISLVAIVVLNGCSLLGGSKTAVKFEVTGTAAAADLVYQYGTGLGTPTGVTLPWSFTYEGKSGDWCSLFAACGSGYVTVTLYKNGSIWLTATNAPGGTFSGHDYAELYGVL